MSPSRQVVVAAMAFLAAAQAWGGASPPLPVGGQFQVNTYITNSQQRPSVSISADGDFVVVWDSDGSSGGDTSMRSIQGQRYAAGGAALGGQFQVNTYITNSQQMPAVSLSADGDFVVVWTSDGSSGGDTSSLSIQGQRYAAGGAALGGQFQVNAYTTDLQFRPSISLDADGDFVVVWQSNGSSGGDTSSFSIQGRRYAAGGAALGGQFQVNAYTTNNQILASIALAADGDFVVAWQSDGSSGGDTSLESVQGQRYAASGAALGGQFQVNAYTTARQDGAAISLDADGEFLVVWSSNGSSGGDTSGASIQGQRYSADGAALGGQFQVNTYTTNVQFLPATSLDADGDFVVVWTSDGSSGGDTSFYSIQGQRYSAGGAALGGQFQVNTYTTGHQVSPEVTLSADGDFVVVWDSNGSSGGDTSSYSVQGQRFLVTGELRGRVFFDANANGLQNVGESGIAGVTVELYDDALALRRTVVTDAIGEYHLRPKEGNWVLRFVAPPAWFTSPDVGDDNLDSDADPATGETASFPVTINVLDTTIDAGFVVLPAFLPIFLDGFETANTTRWSTTVP
jgi:hypothetical protein